jgi:translation initiation factor IF-3
LALPRGMPPRPQHRVNGQIRVREVRLVDVDGGMLGVTPTDEAQKLAFQKGVDLVEVSPDAKPPVCKLLDYGKFKYEQKKKTKESKKKQHVQVLKEVRLRPRTEEHDFMTKVNHARGFLKDGDKVLLTVFFKGRERAHKDQGRIQMVRIKKELAHIGKVERDISMMGPRMQITVAPLPLSKQKPSPKEVAALEAAAAAAAVKAEEAAALEMEKTPPPATLEVEKTPPPAAPVSEDSPSKGEENAEA